MWSFVVNPQVSYAIEPRTGHYLWLLYGDPVAPFDLMIRYPQGNHSCVPGDLLITKKEKGFIIDHYRSKTATIPTFSVAPYKKFIKNKHGFGVEFYIYPKQSLDEELFNDLFNIVQLFYNQFGDNGTQKYKFATVGAYDSTTSGGENKGNVIYFSAQYLNNYQANFNYRTAITAFFAHEIFHNWNLFFVRFTGDLGEWFGEGGANFIAAWALEKIVSSAAGSFVRRDYVTNFITNEGFNAKRPLLTIDKTGGLRESLALIYSYGALVWEQLRQKIGDKALFAGLRQFFRHYGNKNANYRNLLEYLQKETSIDISTFLDPWISDIPKLDLIITNINSEEKGKGFRTTLGIEIQAKKDLEMYTEIGYTTSEEEQLLIKPITFTTKGIHEISFESAHRPIFIQVDPFYRVPQANLENCSWRDDNFIE